MEKVKELTRFYQAVQDDPKIGMSHISLYMALFQLYNLNGFKNPIYVCRKRVMEIAKVNGFATFHKCVKDLNENGYIEYFPSYNPLMHSQVNLVKL